MASVDRNLRKCFTYNWIVENATYYYDEEEGSKVIFSPLFTMDEKDDTEWALALLLDENERRVKQFELIKGPSDRPCDKKIDYELALFTDGKLSKSQMKTERIFSKETWVDSETQEREDHFIVDSSTSLDILTLRCRVWKSAGDFLEDLQCIARTCIVVQERSLMWNIGNFSALKSKKKNSYEITSLNSLKNLLTLDLFLTDDESMRFAVTRNYERIMIATLKLSLVDSSGKTLDCLEENFNFDKSGTSKEFSQFFAKAKLMGKENVQSNDTLSLRCDCTFSFGIIQEKIEQIYAGNTSAKDSEADVCKQNVLSSPKRDLIDSLKSLLKDGCHSDIKRKTSKATYPAHKCILSIRSPVFKAMFANEMKESINHCVDIEDLNDDTVLRMLQYIYGADVDELEWGTAVELYEASDKYEVLSLKDICSSYLKKNLLQSNACEALVLADLHQDEDLKCFVQEFILRHGEDIINSEDWKKMMESHVKLAAETMCLKFKKK